MLSYSQAEPGRELTQPRKHLLAEPCILSYGVQSYRIEIGIFGSRDHAVHWRHAASGLKGNNDDNNTKPP